jgi:peroxiredoxin
MIMDLSNKQFYADDDVFKVLDSIVSTEGSTIEAFYGQGSGYSEGFSFVDDGSSSSGMFSNRYMGVSDSVNEIITPEENEQDNGKNSKNANMLENLLAQRDSDMRNIVGNVPKRVG